MLIGLALIAGGVAGLIWSETQRDDGYVTSSTVGFDSNGYAISGDSVQTGGVYVDSGWEESLLGKVRIHVTPDDPAKAIFVGIARASDVDRYLAGVESSIVREINGQRVRYINQSGSAPAQRPGALTIWVARAEGSGMQTLTWKVRSGSWSVVVMNADASSNVTFRADVGATVPALPWIGAGVIVLGLVVAGLAAVLIAVPIRRAGRDRRERPEPGPAQMPGP